MTFTLERDQFLEILMELLELLRLLVDLLAEERLGQCLAGLA